MESISIEGARSPELFVMCEHGGNQIPAWLDIPTHERHWLKTHWGYDIGAASVARTIAHEAHAQVALAEFSRLVCDPNRPLGSETWIRRTVEDGLPLTFNSDIDDTERDARRELWSSYHSAIDQQIREARKLGHRPLLFSVHSMTHLYAGHARDMELAVLFNDHTDLAERLARALESHGFQVARNEPYSGYDGMMYSVERHGKAHDLPYLEIEVRQDLVETEGSAEAMGRIISRAIRSMSTPEADPAR